MRNITDRFYDAMEHQLAEASTHAERIRICKKAMVKLKNYVSSYAFKTILDEVHFFSVVKPRFYSKFIYFINVHNFLLQRPTGSDAIQRDYIQMHLAELKSFFDHNRAFYSYYRSGMTQMDHIYYTRGGFDVHAELEDFEEDEQYSTSHDYKLSKLIANEMFQNYLNTELALIAGGNGDHAGGRLVFPFEHPSWTATQTDAIELIYALKASGSINNGNIDIATLVAIFEFVFKMELKEYYHKFTDITRRKKDMAIFLGKLKEGLLRWIDGKMGL